MHVNPVAAHLEAYGLTVVRVNLESMFSMSQVVSLLWERGSAAYRVADRWFEPRQVVAAWWRKPHWDRVVREDSLVAATLQRECERANELIWDAIPSEAWLNDPMQMKVAAGKLRQWRIAVRQGFRTPATVVGSDWPAVRSLGDRAPGGIAVKAIDGTLVTETGLRALHTTRLDAASLAIVEAGTASFPGIFQEYVAKRREWRVTVVGSRIFAVEILARGEGADDWRRGDVDEVTFARADLPGRWMDACAEITRQLGLRYSAIDLIESDDGAMWFLEANPNGQFAWLDHLFEGGISRAIADELTAA